MPSTVSVSTDSASEPMSADGFSVSNRNAEGLRITYCSVMATLMMLVSPVRISTRSEEHTSELQSRLHVVCRLLLEKKNAVLVTTVVTAATHPELGAILTFAQRHTHVV